jgi:hypothetical protein
LNIEDLGKLAKGFAALFVPPAFGELALALPML